METVISGNCSINNIFRVYNGSPIKPVTWYDKEMNEIYVHIDDNTQGTVMYSTQYSKETLIFIEDIGLFVYDTSGSFSRMILAVNDITDNNGNSIRWCCLASVSLAINSDGSIIGFHLIWVYQIPNTDPPIYSAQAMLLNKYHQIASSAYTTATVAWGTDRPFTSICKHSYYHTVTESGYADGITLYNKSTLEALRITSRVMQNGSVSITEFNIYAAVTAAVPNCVIDHIFNGTTLTCKNKDNNEIYPVVAMIAETTTDNGESVYTVTYTKRSFAIDNGNGLTLVDGDAHWFNQNSVIKFDGITPSSGQYRSHLIICRFSENNADDANYSLSFAWNPNNDSEHIIRMDNDLDATNKPTEYNTIILRDSPGITPNNIIKYGELRHEFTTNLILIRYMYIVTTNWIGVYRVNHGDKKIYKIQDLTIPNDDTFIMADVVNGCCMAISNKYIYNFWYDGRFDKQVLTNDINVQKLERYPRYNFVESLGVSYDGEYHGVTSAKTITSIAEVFDDPTITHLTNEIIDCRRRITLLENAVKVLNGMIRNETYTYADNVTKQECVVWGRKIGSGSGDVYNDNFAVDDEKSSINIIPDIYHSVESIYGTDGNEVEKFGAAIMEIGNVIDFHVPNSGTNKASGIVDHTCCPGYGKLGTDGEPDEKTYGADYCARIYVDRNNTLHIRANGIYFQPLNDYSLKRPIIVQKSTGESVPAEMNAIKNGNTINTYYADIAEEAGTDQKSSDF